MALIDPQPTRGSWVKSAGYGGTFRPQPTRGSWVRSAGYGGTFRPQPTRGSWVRSAGYGGWKLKGWHVGRVVF